MRLLARETALFHNDLAGADRQLAEISASLQGQNPAFGPGSAEELVALGTGAAFTGVEPKLVLENCFQQAEKMDPPPREAFLATGQLGLLDKHDFAGRRRAFRAGLGTCSPDDPDMECGLARAFESGDREEMLQAIDAALAINPRHVPSLLLLADHLIDAEEYDEAEKQLALVLQVNPPLPAGGAGVSRGAGEFAERLARRKNSFAPRR